MQTMDECPDAYGYIVQDPECHESGKNEQKERAEIQHADVLVHRHFRSGPV